MNVLDELWRWLREIRAPYFAAIALPILLGSAVAWSQADAFDVGTFALSLLAGIFLQAGTNMTNDFYDYGESGGTLPWAIIPPEQALQGALGFLIVGAMVGGIIALEAGPLVLLLGLIGIASGYAYSVPPIRLSGSGLGELLAGLNLGLLTTLGAYYVQTGVVDGIVFWVAAPVVLLMTAVLVLNGFQPSKMERATLWARLGPSWAAAAYALPAIAAYALLIVAVAWERLPQLSLLGLLGLPLTALAIAGAHLRHSTTAIAGAVGAHLSVTALLALAFLAQRLL